MITKVKKPPKYKYRSSDVLWILENRITPGRLRQISNKNHVGILQADFLPPDGSEPKKFTRWYCEADIRKIITLCIRLKNADKKGILNIPEKLQDLA